MKRYATKKEVEEVKNELEKLAKLLEKTIMWQSYETIYRNRYNFSPEVRKQIIDFSKEINDPLIRLLYSQLYP